MDREYAVRVRGEVTEEMIEQLKAGVMLEDGPAKFTDIKEAPGGEGFNRWFHCVVMEGRNREVRRLWESQGVVVSRLKRVRFGPVFMTSDLPMGRWREMGQRELDILSEEVGLKPMALPAMNEKMRDKLDRLQRKAARPLARGERPKRVLRPASEAGEARDTTRGERAPRGPRKDSEQRAPRAPRQESGGRREGGRGTPVAERPADVNKKRTPRPANETSERPARKPRPAAPSKRPPAGDGQRPGFGRKR
jgi:23S rRNA pseudouridine2605 synthase